VGRFKKFMLFLNVLVILATIASYLSPYISPVRFWQFSFFGLVYPWLLVSNILFVLYWGFLKKKWAWISFVCVLLGWNHIGSFVGLSFEKRTTNKKYIKVVSYNMRNLMFIRNKKEIRKIIPKKEQEFLDFLKQKKDIPPIICAQECSTFTTNLIKNKFNYQHHFRIPKKAVTIFSKYPIINKGEIKTEPDDNYCLWVDLKLENNIIRVYSG